MAPNWMKHFNNDPFILFALRLSVCVVILSIILVACVARKSVNEVWQGVRVRRNPVPAPATTPRSEGIELRPVSGRRSYRGMPTMQTIEEEPNGEAAASTSNEEQSLEQPVVASASGSDGVDAGLIAGSHVLDVSDDGDSDPPTRQRRQKEKERIRE